MALAVWIAIAAIHRLNTPQPLQPKLMTLDAAAGLPMNGCIAALLWRFSGDVNIRSVFLHMPGHPLSTAAVIAGGAGILFTGMMWIDPVLSILIAGMILYSSIGIVRETLHILLEGTPHGILIEAVRTAMQAVDGVLNVHDLHVWSLGSSSHALASHVTICEMPVSDCAVILERLNQTLIDRFHIHHTTLQFEITDCATTHGCAAPPPLEAVGAHGHHHHHG